MNLNRVLYTNFYELVLEKGITHITIQKLLEKSEVSRATFYRHFRDKYDLMTFGIADFFDKQNYQPGVDDWQQLIRNTLSYFQKHQAYFYKIANVQTQNSLHQFLTSYCTELTKETVMKNAGLHQLDYFMQAAINYTINGSLAVTHDWIAGNFVVPIGDVTKAIFENIPQSLQPYLI